MDSQLTIKGLFSSNKFSEISIKSDFMTLLTANSRINSTILRDSSLMSLRTLALKIKMLMLMKILH